jgi:three-Cys-motif partner protein
MSSTQRGMTNSQGITVWHYEGQTRCKHAIVQQYFDRWVKILGKWNSLNCFDCFGGCGAYYDDNPDDIVGFGSPILEGLCIDANHAFLDRNVDLVVIEQDHSNVENMKRVFQLASVHVQPLFIESEFDKAVNQILDDNRLAPSFFFIDPFGFDIRFQTLARIMQTPKSELVINFMFNAVSRFLSAKPIADNLTSLYGTDAWQELTELSGQPRENGLTRLYKDQLKKLGRFVYGYPMSFEDKHRTYYYLFHVTNSAKGCSIMKSVVAGACGGALGYRGPDDKDIALFDLPEARVGEAKNLICTTYGRKTLSYGRLVADLIDSTPYLESDIHKAVQQLEATSNVTVNRFPNGHRRNGLMDTDMLSFS